MNKNLILKSIAVTLWLTMPYVVFSQAAPWSRLGMGARGMGAGNASSAVTSDGVYSLYNPAQTATTQTTQVEMSSAVMPFGVKWNLLHGAVKLPPKAAVQFGLMHSGVREIDARTPSGYSEGLLETNEFMLFTSFGIQFSERFKGGIGFKFFRSNLHEEVPVSTTSAVDAGFLLTPIPTLNIGFSIHDLLGSYKWNTQEFYDDETASFRKNDLPKSTKLALAYTPITSSTISLEWQRTLVSGNTVVTATPEYPDSFLTLQEKETTSASTSFRAGLRHTFSERFVLRSGVELNAAQPDAIRFSFGGSVLLPFDSFAPAIDYAVVRPAYGIGFIHVFSLRFSWNQDKN